jgi:hypothetical protein
VIDERAVARDSGAAGISLRTGCFCNPGAGEAAFGLGRREPCGAGRPLSGRRSAGVVDDYLSLVGLPTGGAVRVSLGIASTIADVDAFLDFAERTYRDRHPDLAGLVPSPPAQRLTGPVTYASHPKGNLPPTPATQKGTCHLRHRHQ